MTDLVILVADKNAQFALKGALSRPKALGICPIQFEFRIHAGRDGGVRTDGPEMLALERRRFRHALLVLDFDGCGTELPDAKALEAKLDRQLSALWHGTAKAIVIEPELDVWVWGADNAALEAALRMPRPPRSSALYQRIAEKISLRQCGDEAFIRLREQLVDWFPG